jgi:hypothetical protein
MSQIQGRGDMMRFIISGILIMNMIMAEGSGQSLKMRFRYEPAEGIGPEPEVMRRDPSDIIKVGETYYIWYTKGAKHDGYDATIWYATSEDGRRWVEQGEALGRGPEGAWDEQSVFTPNILIAEGRYWLLYTGVPKPFHNQGNRVTKTAIGIAVSHSPGGPWRKLDGNPILLPSEDPDDFDSMRVDDSCLIVREGKYWLYYKGRKWDDTPANTKMGVAIAEKPEGPYIKHASNPVIEGGHEVLVWPEGKGIVAMITNCGPEGVRNTLQYAENGLDFTKMGDLEGRVPHGPGAYRPEAFTDSGKGATIGWGIHIGGKEGFLPFLERFECILERSGVGGIRPLRK